MEESQVLGFERQVESGGERSAFQGRGDRAYREFLSRVYWGYQEGEEGDPGEDEGFVGIIDATCANGG